MGSEMCIRDRAKAAAKGKGEGKGSKRGKRGGERKGGDRLTQADTDGDGLVSKAEFLAQAEERFAKLDGDSDGLVTGEEVKAAVENSRKEGKRGKRFVNMIALCEHASKAEFK